MARGNNIQNLLIAGGVVYLALKSGMLKGLGFSANAGPVSVGGGIGGGGGAAPGAAPSSPAAGGQAPPMDGQNYVAPYGAGYVVVVNGALRGTYATQSEAERAYNTARGFPN